MDALKFTRILLKTAFACMACDGDIDQREVRLIKKLHVDNRVFGDLDISSEMDALLHTINEDGNDFFADYFRELASADLSQEEELKLIEIGINTIMADEKVEYSEIKFFKLFRSKLNIPDKPILEKHPDFEEYLEKDIMSDSYLSQFRTNLLGINNLNSIDLRNLIIDTDE